MSIERRSSNTQIPEGGTIPGFMYPRRTRTVSPHTSRGLPFSDQGKRANKVQWEDDHHGQLCLPTG